MNLVQEGTALQPLFLLFSEEYREVVKILRQNVDVDVPRRLIFPLLLHYVGG